MHCPLVNVCAACIPFFSSVNGGNINNMHACGGERGLLLIQLLSTLFLEPFPCLVLYFAEKYVNPIKYLLFSSSMASVKAVTFAFALENLALNILM